MSNLLFMDETNGNGVYATKHSHNATATTNSSSGNSNSAFTATANYINSMTGGATVASAATLPTSGSNEDLSQSLSEYTDADESISAPTEFLAEFLSAVMLKDYKKALKYCKLILQYEPHNSTAKEFYPLILDKLRGAASSDSDENYNKSSSPEMILEQQYSDPSVGESDDMGFNKQQMVECVEDAVKDVDGYGVSEDNSSGEPNSRESHMSSSSCDSTDHSLSESVDEENDNDNDDGGCDVGDEEQEEEEGDVLSVSGEDLPIDDPNLMGDVSMADDGGGGSTDGNGSQSSRNSSSGGEGRSRSDNTTHSYSSLLLEEEEADIVPVSLQLSKELSHPDLDVSNGNKILSTSCSDSESPTEPLTQRLAAILLSKCGVSSNASNH